MTIHSGTVQLIGLHITGGHASVSEMFWKRHSTPSPVERVFPELIFLALPSLLAGTSTFTLLMNQCARFLPFPGKGVQHPPLLNDFSQN